jgi:hypothetical protein
MPNLRGRACSAVIPSDRYTPKDHQQREQVEKGIVPGYTSIPHLQILLSPPAPQYIGDSTNQSGLLTRPICEVLVKNKRITGEGPASLERMARDSMRIQPELPEGR